jgi:hypothetical protein
MHEGSNLHGRQQLLQQQQQQQDQHMLPEHR